MDISGDPPATSQAMAASNSDLTNRISNEKALCFSSTYCTHNAASSRVSRITFLRNVGGNILHSAIAQKIVSLGVHIYKSCQDYKWAGYMKHTPPGKASQSLVRTGGVRLNSWTEDMNTKRDSLTIQSVHDVTGNVRQRQFTQQYAVTAMTPFNSSHVWVQI